MDRDQIIREKAATSCSIVLPWNFQPSKHLYVDDHDTESYIGELYYNNPNFEIGAAVKVRNWVFVLERMTVEARMRLVPENDPDVWVIAAFNNNSHYSFIPIHDVSQSGRNNKLITYIVETFWPILHPEVFDSYLRDRELDKQDKIVKWEIKPL